MSEQVKKRKKRDTSAKRNSILDAAVKAFSEEGYYNATMDRIADLAQASKRTLYNHFPSKDVLFDAVIGRYLSQQRQLRNIPYESNESLYEQLSRLADSEIYLVNSPDRRGLAKVLTAVFLQDPQLAMEARMKHNPGMDLVIQWFGDACENGDLSADDPQSAAILFFSMVQGRITYPALFQPLKENYEYESEKREVIETFLCRFGNRS